MSEQQQQFQIIGQKAEPKEVHTFIVSASTESHAKKQAESRGYQVHHISVYTEPNRREERRERSYYKTNTYSPFRRVTFGQYVLVVIFAFLITGFYLYTQGWRLSDYEAILNMIIRGKDSLTQWFE